MRRTLKGRLPGIELSATASSTTLDFLAYRNWLVASKTLSHIYHSALAVPVALFQLLALRWESFEKRGTEALGGGTTLDHNTVGRL